MAMGLIRSSSPKPFYSGSTYQETLWEWNPKTNVMTNVGTEQYRRTCMVIGKLDTAQEQRGVDAQLILGVADRPLHHHLGGVKQCIRCVVPEARQISSYSNGRLTLITAVTGARGVVVAPLQQP